jgi:hypothetical protein
LSFTDVQTRARSARRSPAGARIDPQPWPWPLNRVVGERQGASSAINASEESRPQRRPLARLCCGRNGGADEPPRRPPRRGTAHQGPAALQGAPTPARRRARRLCAPPRLQTPSHPAPRASDGALLDVLADRRMPVRPQVPVRPRSRGPAPETGRRRTGQSLALCRRGAAQPRPATAALNTSAPAPRGPAADSRAPRRPLRRPDALPAPPRRTSRRSTRRRRAGATFARAAARTAPAAASCTATSSRRSSWRC